MKFRSFAQRAVIAGSAGALAFGLVAAPHASAMTLVTTITGMPFAGPVAASQASGGPVYVGNAGADDSVYVIDSLTNSLVSTFAVGGTNGIGVLATGSAADDSVYAAQTVAGDDTVTAVAGSSGIPGPTWLNTVSNLYPWGMAVAQTDSHDDTLYVAFGTSNGTGRGYVAVLDAVTMTLDDSFSVPTASGIALVGDDSILVSSRTGSLTIVNARNFDDSQSISLPAAAGVAVSPDGQWAYVVSTYDIPSVASVEDLIRINPATATVDDSMGIGNYFTHTGSLDIAVATDGTIFVQGFDRVVGVDAAFTGQGAISTGSNLSPRFALSSAQDLYVSYQSGGSVSVYTPTSPAPPAPAPVYPPSAPQSVTAVAGDASATVSWAAPSSTGSYPVSNYQVASLPGGKICLVQAPALSCKVTGLVAGVTYTFTVKALNGAGWGASSDPSNAVTPSTPATKSIVISGSRDSSDTRIVRVSGRATDLAGAVATPYVKRAGDSTFTAGTSAKVIKADGTFDWRRKTSREIQVYFIAGGVRSNTVAVAAR